MMFKQILEVPTAIEQYINKPDIFNALLHMQGRAFRDVKGRKTIQVRLESGNEVAKSYFIKQHFGVGWCEIIKNLTAFKWPILGAMTEVKAIQKLNSLNIATTPLVAYGQRGHNPATLQSFVLTADLGDITSLEDLTMDWPANPPDAIFKRKLIIAVAKIAKKLHENGINHRDFYIGHFCLDNLSKPDIKLYLIDLHRVLIHAKPSINGNMKDIAALYFSSMDIGLTKRDLMCFRKHYSKMDKQFWQLVELRATKLYAKFHSQKFQQRLKKEKSAIH